MRKSSVAVLDGAGDLVAGDGDLGRSGRLSTDAMNSLKVSGWWPVWNVVEKFHTRTPTTTRTIQKTRLFSVEFKLPSHVPCHPDSGRRQVKDQDYHFTAFCCIKTSFPRRSSTRAPGRRRPPSSPLSMSAAVSTCSSADLAPLPTSAAPASRTRRRMGRGSAARAAAIELTAVRVRPGERQEAGCGRARPATGRPPGPGRPPGRWRGRVGPP